MANPQQIHPVPVVRNEPPKPVAADYDKPVRVKRIKLGRLVRVVHGRESSGAEQAQERDFIDAASGFVIEVDNRRRMVRIWSTGIANAPVTTASFDGPAWFAGDVENVPQPPEPAKAA